MESSSSKHSNESTKKDDKSSNGMEESKREDSASPEVDISSESPLNSPMQMLEKQDGYMTDLSSMKHGSETIDIMNSPNQRSRTVSYKSSDVNNENIISSLTAWDWVVIDGLQLPAVTREQERFVTVHMVQLKLLSKFPSNIPPDIVSKFTMGAHKMTLAEAWTFNSINAIIRKFDLGCQLFTPNDELVKLNDVQMFYWNVKLFNLIRIKSHYEQTLTTVENNIPLTATVVTLKNQVENDIMAVRAELRRLENMKKGNTSQEEVPSQSPSKKLVSQKS